MSNLESARSLHKIPEKVLHAGQKGRLRKLENDASGIIAWQTHLNLEKLEDHELRDKTDEFKKKIHSAKDEKARKAVLDEILPDAFALVREAARRTVGMEHFNRQLMGGIVLHQGNIAEMKTGEGKTLAATTAVYLNALEELGVHVITVNDYLARRDAEWMKPVYEKLGLSVGVVLPNRPAQEHREAYACDVTYGTANEFGFDYLRDNMATTPEDRVQRGHHFAIVDEVDSILIDEARNPLYISGPEETANIRWYKDFNRLAKRMVRENPDDQDAISHYEIDEAKRTVEITQAGIDLVEDQLGIDNLYELNNTPLVGYLENAIRAKELYQEGREYIIQNGEAIIVDENTGRLMYGRRFNEGLHQAVEAKHGLKIQGESEMLATVTLQNYFRLYKKLSGMTGTAKTDESEFHKIYKLDVVSIPTQNPMIRDDQDDVVYQTEEAKFNAVVDDIIEHYKNGNGQPILVGTASVAKSEYLSKLLTKRAIPIPHEVLNAKYHAKEADIIAEAGKKGIVTIATNMAGRGVDIHLGGEKPPDDAPEAVRAAWQEAHDEVVSLGGLYVLGTERHDARRIDDQLRGRAGRQGDPGKSRFYLSLEDDLMKKFPIRAAQAILARLNIPLDTPIHSKLLTRQIKGAQIQLEDQNREIRKKLVKYDHVLNMQRKTVYTERDKIMEGSSELRQIVYTFINDTVDDYITAATADYPEEWDLDQLWEDLGKIHTPDFTTAQLVDAVGGDQAQLTRDFLRKKLKSDFRTAYDRKLGKGEIDKDVEKLVLLELLDRKWREQLSDMEYLQNGIGHRSYVQKDPYVEYEREGLDLFNDMKEQVKKEAVTALFHTRFEEN